MAHPGDIVTIEIHERPVLAGICAVYLLPVVGLLAGAAVGRLLGAATASSASDAFSAALGFLGLAAALCLVARSRRRRDSDRSIVPVIMTPAGHTESEQNGCKK